MSAPGRAPAAAPFQQFVSRLSAHWEGDAAILRHRGAVSEAITLESCAVELLEPGSPFFTRRDDSGASEAGIGLQLQCDPEDVE